MKLTNRHAANAHAFMVCAGCGESKHEEQFAWQNGKRRKRCRACVRNTPAGNKAAAKNNVYLDRQRFET